MDIKLKNMYIYVYVAAFPRSSVRAHTAAGVFSLLNSPQLQQRFKSDQWDHAKYLKSTNPGRRDCHVA